MSKTSDHMPTQAVILAAGFGKRMRPLTEHCPKPLLEVDGRTMLDRIFDALVEADVRDVIVNTHYLAEQVEDCCRRRKDVNIRTSYETEILETGGGVKKVLQHIDKNPFYVLNGDVIWQDFPGHAPALQGLAGTWNPEKMDLLLMVYPREKLPEGSGLQGDYEIDDAGRLQHKIGGPYVFAGPRIVSPALFDNTPEGAFSFLDLFHKAQNAGRLYGFIHQGAWHHAGTPEDLAAINAIYRNPRKMAAT
ncbi:MAG: nucleotidyltransferase family protein [Pseudomonadota bacterium]|nr:nucleotidyltransferase family protein [Pseudomonadota bacterium]QKK05318.1 MAG: nucleotidyltransferase family protein [Pseudomonadota bacterium]